MARPKTKTELLNAAETQYERLNRLIDNMGSDKQHETFDPSLTRMSKEAHWTRDKNLRDILAHLYEWQQMLLSFVDNNSQSMLNRFFLLRILGELRQRSTNKSGLNIKTFPLRTSARTWLLVTVQ